MHRWAAVALCGTGNAHNGIHIYLKKLKIQLRTGVHENWIDTILYHKLLKNYTTREERYARVLDLMLQKRPVRYKNASKSKRENFALPEILVERSAEEHRYVAADVVQAIITGVDILVIAEAGQRDEDYDEARLHEEPG